ncbi:MAG: hypothetical protein QM523_00750 [Candidatus Pacebacteria bacterium]|nr:hypothetical protein [Candidatus Paceibacterota bacterium]
MFILRSLENSKFYLGFNNFPFSSLRGSDSDRGNPFFHLKTITEWINGLPRFASQQAVSLARNDELLINATIFYGTDYIHPTLAQILHI